MTQNWVENDFALIWRWIKQWTNSKLRYHLCIDYGLKNVHNQNFAIKKFENVIEKIGNLLPRTGIRKQAKSVI